MESDAGADRLAQFQSPVKKEPIPRPKPTFIRALDDTKPVLQDPILRSDPIETEEAVLRLPPLSSAARSKVPSNALCTKCWTGLIRWEDELRHQHE
ncbi:hypothetical protein BT93_B2275 [Corymbia citriodora subsp. variegata]|nr:hypothetical protein BT93_B2275 [Corymbia citriodora subsp. variegata]